MIRLATALAASTALFLSACGTEPGERAATGAGTGAGAGAVIGAVTGLSVLEGALLGAAAGGLTGGLTDADFLNLGDLEINHKAEKVDEAVDDQVDGGDPIDEH